MNALKTITNRAKQLKKKNPGAKWINLVKKAGAEYRAKHKPKAKPKKVKALRKMRARVGLPASSDLMGRVTGGATVAQHVAAIKSKLTGQIASLEVQKFKAITTGRKRSVKKIAKKIQAKKREYRRY